MSDVVHAFLRDGRSLVGLVSSLLVGLRSNGRNDELDMRGMNEDDLMTLCALSGCDYLPSVRGMGLKKAHRMVSRHKEVL